MALIADSARRGSRARYPPCEEARVFPADVLDRAKARNEAASCVCEACLDRANQDAGR